jgi:hypothetical protein
MAGTAVALSPVTVVVTLEQHSPHGAWEVWLRSATAGNEKALGRGAGLVHGREHQVVPAGALPYDYIYIYLRYPAAAASSLAAFSSARVLVGENTKSSKYRFSQAANAQGGVFSSLKLRRMLMSALHVILSS